VALAEAGAGADPLTAPVAGCVFCDAAAQPEPLFTTERLRVFPDLYPVTPGHVLVTPKAHLACFGAAPSDLIEEAEAAATRAANFIRRAYGRDPILFENGVAGQTVFHAHLHLIPIADPVELDAEADDARAVEGMAALPAYFAEHGRYHYAAVAGQHVVMAGDGPSSWRLRLAVAREAGAARIAEHYLKRGRDEEVAELLRRWRAEAPD